MEESNYYEDKKNREFLDNTPKKDKGAGEPNLEKTEKEETQKEKLIRTAKEVGTDLAVGVIGGGLGAAVCGRYSLLTGFMVSGWGHYVKNKYIARLGLGLMASSSMSMAQGVKQDPNAPMMQNMQERVKAFGQELQRKLFLDKLNAKKNPEIINSDLNGTAKEPKAPVQLKKVVNPEKEYLKPEDTGNPASTLNESEGSGGSKSNTSNNNYDDEDFTSIEERLY